MLLIDKDVVKEQQLCMFELRYWREFNARGSSMMLGKYVFI
jgi:hypothetical protein